MTTLSTTLRKNMTFKGITCLGLVAMADQFFYHPYPLGWVLGAFGAAFLAAIVFHTAHILSSWHGKTLSLLASVLTLGMIESPNALHVMLYIVCILGLVIPSQPGIWRWLKAVLYYCIYGLTRFTRDIFRIAAINRKNNIRPCSRFLAVFALPIGLSIVFVSLFSIANPIIAQWVDKMHWREFFDLISIARLCFWLIIATICWAFIRSRMPKLRPATFHGAAHRSGLDSIFNASAVAISLLVFNLLFLLQNSLDIAFLWGDAQLPGGMTHAAYAHQGAYPLIVTALLAGAFVLLALRQNATSMTQYLMYLWVGQNIFLVISSITRLLNYVEFYSLTYLRVAAFIWMGLVAGGLMLIIARIYFCKTSRWLINANLIMLFATLYISSFMPVGRIIAEYNVRHSKEITGEGSALDLNYLRYAIGPDALPALQWFVEYESECKPCRDYREIITEQSQQNMQSTLKNSLRPWQSWNYRNARLVASLDVQ